MNPIATSFLFALLLPCLGLAQQQPAPAFTLEGRVTDLRGEPVPLAEVWIATSQELDRRLAESVCDGEGFFRIGRVPPRDSYVVHATKDGMCVATDWVSREPALVRLHEAAVLRGVLQNAAGEPVAGVVVRAMGTSRALQAADTSVTTAADGSFVVAKAPFGPMLLAAAVPGEGLYTARTIVSGDAQVRLERAPGIMTSIRIAVTRLPADARSALAISVLPNGSYNRLPPPWQRPRIDAEGKCVLTDLPDTDYSVRPYSRQWSFVPERAQVKAGTGPHELSFAAHRIGTSPTECRVVLCDAQGEPLAGVRLALRAASESQRTEVTTADDGTATFASHKGEGAKIIIYSLDERWVLDQAKGEGLTGHHDRRFLSYHEWVVDPKARLGLRAVPACNISGRIVLGDGRPAAFVRAQLEEIRSSRSPQWMTMKYATTDRDGRYRFSGVHHLADPVRVMVEADQGFVMGDPLTLDEPGTDIALDELRLQAPAVIEGVVRNAAGQPAPGIRVWLRDWDFERESQRSGSVVEVVTDRLGRYRFASVPGGGAWLQLLAEGRSPNGRAVEPFEVKAGERYTYDLEMRR